MPFYGRSSLTALSIGYPRLQIPNASIEVMQVKSMFQLNANANMAASSITLNVM
jgi:hypothetical protein